MTAFIVLKKETINKHEINTNSLNKIFLAEWKSLMELDIINKKLYLIAGGNNISEANNIKQYFCRDRWSNRLHLQNQHAYMKYTQKQVKRTISFLNRHYIQKSSICSIA